MNDVIKHWPYDEREPVSFDELCLPVVEAIENAYRVERNDCGDIPWNGRTLGKSELATCQPPHEALKAENLKRQWEDQGRNALEVIVGIGIQTGIEQGRRVERRESGTWRDMHEKVIASIEVNNTVYARIEAMCGELHEACEIKYYKFNGKYVLAEDVWHECRMPWNGSTELPEFVEWSASFLHIKAGYVWDGASGGYDTKNAIRASLVHDALYDLLSCGAIAESGRRRIDLEFRRILREDGMTYLRRWAWYAAVRLGGWAHV